MHTTMRSPTFFRARCAAIVVGLAACSRAQIIFETIPPAECSASDLAGYDFKAEPLGSGLSLHWSVSQLGTISFEVSSIDSEVGWLSIGFSADGNMIGADAVVGAGGVVLEYNLGSKAPPVQLSPTTEESISPFPEQEITNAALERVGNSISMSFTRPTTPASVGKQSLFPASGGPVVLLWAAGPDETFDYHFLGRGAFTVDLLCEASQPVVEVEQPLANPDREIVATGASSSIPPLTEAPSMSPPEALELTFSPTSAPTSLFSRQQPSDGSATSGALPGLMQAGGSLFGLRGGVARAMAFGLFLVGVYGF